MHVTPPERKYRMHVTFISENNEHCPLCLICNKVLASESLKPGKLKRHLQTEHVSHRNRSVEFFIAYCGHGKEQRQSFASEFIIESIQEHRLRFPC